MATTHPISRDIYIDKGTDFSQTIELSVPFVDYEFTGSIKSSYSSPNAVPITFEPVFNEPNKAIISVTATNTLLLRRLRGVYDIFGTHKVSGEVHKEREGTAHYNDSASINSIPLPPPQGYRIVLADVTDAGTAAASNIEDFASAAQGLLADTALQADDLAGYLTIGSAATTYQPIGNYAPSSGISPSAIIGTAVITSDSRLTDARVPIAHTHTGTALTPASVAASGTVTGSNLSGNNTGDQLNILGNAATVTTNANLTGIVTSVGNATSIADGALSIAKTNGLSTALSLLAPKTNPEFSETLSITNVGSGLSGVFSPGDLTGVQGYVTPDASGFLAITADGTGIPDKLHNGTISGTVAFASGVDATFRTALKAPASDPTGITGADAITNIVSLTAAEYAAIGSPSATTLYVVI